MELRNNQKQLTQILRARHPSHGEDMGEGTELIYTDL